MQKRFGILLLFIGLYSAIANLALAQQSCNALFTNSFLVLKDQQIALPLVPREIKSQKTFDNLVDWVYEDLIIRRNAPGFVVGISGTDSILSFLIVAKAFEKAGKPERAVGIHYGARVTPEMLAEVENSNDYWMQTQIMPWLQKMAPRSTLIIDSSIDYRRDGLRWGALVDWSVIMNQETGFMRMPQDRYWVVGTRNATEEALMNYSNISTLASVQVIPNLWKSEVLKLSEFLGVPKVAIEKSCQADCVCGRFDLPAAHIAEMDAILMVRAGKLSPGYIENTIPWPILTQLDQFIENQIEGAKFKKEIPYKPEESVVESDFSLPENQFALLKENIQKGSADTKPLSKLVPTLIANSNANAAAELVGTIGPNRDAWLPEALTLFNTPGLLITQQARMIERIFRRNDLSLIEVKRLSRINGKIGNYGFSFPQWRFLSQRYDGRPALVEQFGMEKLIRETDVRDQTLPFSDPNRDLFGTGFIWKNSEWYVEYRRAYIVCSHLTSTGTATIILRNNSYFYGRDRLPQAVYVSWEPFTTEQLQNLTVDILENSKRFIPWQNIFTTSKTMPVVEILTRTESLLSYLDQFNLSINKWLRTSGSFSANTQGGLNALLDFFQNKISTDNVNAKPPFYLTVMNGTSPSWFPKNVVPVTKDLIDEVKVSGNLDKILNLLNENKRIVILSGEKGDYP